MKQFLFKSVVLAMCIASQPLQAADWPQRPVRLIVPSGPGSSPDIFGRLLGDALSKKTGQSFIVENRPGASGNIGVDQVTKSAPDGYTLGVVYPAPMTTNTLMMKMPYDPLKNLTLITNAVLQTTVLATSNSMGAKNLSEFTSLLRSNPGKYNTGSLGTNSLGRLAAEVLVKKVGTKTTNIPYASGAQTMIAMVQGDVQFAIQPAAAVVPYYDSGKVKILAVTSDKRSQLLPDIPTLTEFGIADVEAVNWLGIVGPAGMDPALVNAVKKEVSAVLANPSLRNSLAKNYMEVLNSSSEEFTAQVKKDIQQWAPIIKELDIKGD